ncbi:MAG: YggS family pyridoxal phosphate-dependent enzyme [Anaerolineales bacterium]|nr:YggS family pyridoxal phosphate-dependent enzyme [Anaerolineales bacterium]
MDETLVISIRERYERVLAQIADAAHRSGNASARLVVVSKAQPLEVVRAAIQAGVQVFGENYAEEAVEKIAALGEVAVEWHMIGHVQSRKAALVAEHFDMVHSLDSLKLAARLERFCAEKDRTLPVLLEMNVSGEASKFGFPAWDENNWPDLVPLLAQFEQFSHLKVRGLMTMPPYFEDAQQARPYFQRLRRLRDFLAKSLPVFDWLELSMGTSTDFVVAVEEGATLVRIGQAILGPRPKRMEESG